MRGILVEWKGVQEERPGDAGREANGWPLG